MQLSRGTTALLRDLKKKYKNKQEVKKGLNTVV